MEQDKVIRLDLGFEPEAAISGPILLQSDYATFLTFNAVQERPDGLLHNVGTGVVEFEGCQITKFGYPNDEALGGHPLYHRGLEFYAVFEVLNSSWIRQMEEQNRVCFPSTSAFRSRHFIITFHDSTFECVADGFSATLSIEPCEQLLRKLTERLHSNG
jgi:hypothetical protein